VRLDLSASPRLLGKDEMEVTALRKKDLALLTYFWAGGPKRHQRSYLASLLWANRDERKARHSLTQALRRIQSVVGEQVMHIGQSQIEWRQPAPKCMELLECSGSSFDELRDNSGAGLFLDGFFVGSGAQAFDAWVEQKRQNLKTLLSDHCKTQGREAERLEKWEEALKFAQCAVSIDPFDEEAHRRIMRAWAGLGQKSKAIKHHEQFAEMLRKELDETPDHQTETVRREIAMRR
jgi:DNA-binding SARP family transcriptional activator